MNNKIKIIVRHAKSLRDVNPARPGPFFKAFAKTVELPEQMQFDQIPEWVFVACNLPASELQGEQLSFCTEYRAAKLRSLSYGDVVQVGDHYFFCDSFGWKEIGPDDAEGLRVPTIKLLVTEQVQVSYEVEVEAESADAVEDSDIAEAQPPREKWTEVVQEREWEAASA